MKTNRLYFRRITIKYVNKEERREKVKIKRDENQERNKVSINRIQDTMAKWHLI